MKGAPPKTQQRRKLVMAYMKPSSSEHPKVLEAFELLKAGRMDRREFVRGAALLGTCAAAAQARVGLPDPVFAATSLPFGPDDPQAKTGGILKFAMQVQKMEDPANYSWVQMSNQTRHTLEYMAMTGPDNVTRPMLAESWTAAEDLKTWTFNLRKGVMWHNGDELVADHIVWNINRWLDPKTASSNVYLAVVAAIGEEAPYNDAKGKPINRMVNGAVEDVDK